MKDALKLTLEVLESGVDTQIGRLAWTAYDSCLINEAITAIKEALAPTSTQCEVQPEQESVAWIHNFIEGGISIGKRPSDLNRHPERWTALYRESKPCPTCEALARTVMLDQTSHDTKRPWVGLTDYERANCWRFSAKQCAINIEAKLKEKNT